MRSACSRPCASGCGVKRSGSEVLIGSAILMPMSRRTLLRSAPQTISNSTNPWKWIRSLPSSKGRCLPPWIIAIIRCHTARRSPWVTAGQKRIKVTPLDAQPATARLRELKAEILRRWPMTGLLDMLKETDFRVGFTRVFDTTASESAKFAGDSGMLGGEYRIGGTQYRVTWA